MEINLTSNARDVSLKAQELFESSGWLCGESVLLAFAEAAGIESPLIPRMATGFCAGLGRSGELCGAVAGAIMVIGLGMGRKSTTDSVEKPFDHCREIVNKVQSIYGSTKCIDIIGLDFRKPDDRIAFKEKAVKPRVCVPLVGMMAELSYEAVARGLKSQNGETP